MQKLAFFLPTPAWGKLKLNRCLKHVQERLGKQFVIQYFAQTPNEFKIHEKFQTLEILPCHTAHNQTFDLLVYEFQQDMPVLKHVPEMVYSIDRHAMLRQEGNFPDILDTWTQDYNEFRKISDIKLPIGFRYFPYTHQIRRTWGGPVNAFGHRISVDYRDLIERPKNHIIMAHFGGSTGYSTNCLDDEMYSSLVALWLNKHCQKEDINLTFTSLNFSVVGDVVLGQMMNYLLYCNELKPDIVISHDGWNDIVMGAVNDPDLVDEYKINYLLNQKVWAEVLHSQEPNRGIHIDHSVELEVRNSPDAIVDAYLNRKKQFSDLVTNAGTDFIWGFQPAVFSKKSPSNWERPYTDESTTGMNPALKKSFCIAPRLFDYASKKQQEFLDKEYLDLHQAFSAYGNEEELFDDRCHTTAEGDYRIAECYFEFIKSKLLTKYIT